MNWFGVWIVFSVLVSVQIQTADTNDAANEKSDEVIVNQMENVEHFLSDFVEKVSFFETFNENSKTKDSWIRSEAKKEGSEEEIAKYDGIWSIEAAKKDNAAGFATFSPSDLGLVLKSKARHAAIGSPLRKRFSFTANQPLIVQYEVQFQDGLDCGGGYLKLLSGSNERKSVQDMLKMFHDKTLYSIMFGPDKCGTDTKLHFIFQYRHPKNGTFMEKHCEKPIERFDEVFNDKLPHFFKLELQPNSDFKIFVDNKEMISGSLLDKFDPPVNPPKEIDDPMDKKPADWDDRAQIVDPDAKKPDDWDESEPKYIEDMDAVKPSDWLDDEEAMILDPSSEKPDDWDESIDGDWEPASVPNPKCKANQGHCGEWKRPQILNPNYRGKWSAPLIDNVNYKGKWTPRKIPNPDFFEDPNPFDKLLPIDAVGFELWSMSQNILFDNILITNSNQVSQVIKENTFDFKIRKIDSASNTFLGKFMKSIKFKLNWWITYVIYLSIPITLYVGYLIKRAFDSENITEFRSSVVSWFVDVTNEHPWLWAVYILMLGIVVSLFVYCCKPSTSRTDSSAQPLITTESHESSSHDEKEELSPRISTDYDEPGNKNSDESDEEENDSEDIEIIEAKINDSQNGTTRKRKPKQQE